MPGALARLAICVVFVLCFLGHAGHPPVADEIDFILPLERWAALGPQKAGLWHSPLYPWLLSLLGRSFAVTPMVFRTVGLFTTATTALLVKLALGRLSGAPRGGASPRWKTPTLLALCLLSPACLGSALLLDYDTTLLVAATAFYFYLLTTFERERKVAVGRIALVFGLALALCLLCKETTPLIYPAGVIATFRRRLGFARATLAAVASALLGVALFLALAALWCAHYGLPLSAVFEMDLLGLRIHGTEHGPGSWAAGLWVKTMPLFWIGLPLTLLAAARLPRLLLGEGAAAGIALVTVLVMAAYTFALRQDTYHFPKYMAPVLPWLAWLAMIGDQGDPAPLRKHWLAGWTIAIIAWFLFAWDPLIILYRRDLVGLELQLLMLGFPLAAWGVFRLVGWPAPSIARLALLLALGGASSYGLEALFSPKSVTYWYGDRALAEAHDLAERWRARNPSGNLIIPAKDLAYETRTLGARHLDKDPLARETAALCASHAPLLVITRLREESSLSRAPELAELRRCLGSVIQDGDLAYGSRPAR